MVELGHLWHEYRAMGSKIAKDKLLVEYSHLVKYVAQRVGAGLPRTVDRDDLYSVGIFGLIKAVETFDPERGFKFETYAVPKIRGAILDELRALDWVPRTVRQKTRDLQNTVSKLENKLGRSPYDDEVCEELGISIEEYEELLSEIAPITFMSFDELSNDPFSESKDIHIADKIADDNTPDPLEAANSSEMKKMLTEAIGELNENERAVVALYHYEEMTLKEIGDAMNLTESRVCQIHARAMTKLRAKMNSKAV